MVMNFLFITTTILKIIFLKKIIRKVYYIFDILLSLTLIIIIVLEFLKFNNTAFIIIKSLKSLRIIKVIFKVEYFGVIRLLLKCLI